MVAEESLPKGFTHSVLLNFQALHLLAAFAGTPEPQKGQKAMGISRGNAKAIVGHVGNFTMHLRLTIRSKTIRTQNKTSYSKYVFKGCMFW